MSLYQSTPEELLYAFLDGELDSTSEDTLFSLLSQSTDLRLEMRELLRIRSEIQRDVLYPPSLMTHRVFSGIGFNTPGIQSESFLAGIAWRPIMSRMGLSVLSAMLGSALTLWLFSTQDHQSLATPPVPVSASSVQQGISQEQKTIPHTLSDDQKSITLHRRSHSMPAQSKTRSSVTDGIEKQDASPFSALMSADRMKSPLSFQTTPTFPSLVERMAMMKEEQPETVDTRRVSLRLAGYAARSYPKATIESQSRPFFTNISIGVLYTLSEHDEIGLAGGREAFSQVFTGQDNGRTLRYEQNPLLYWGGVFYKLNADPLPFTESIHPFSEVFAGIAYQGGPLGGITLGLQYNDARMSMMLGVEGKMLRYQFQQQWFTTSKLGIVYGMSFHL